MPRIWHRCRKCSSRSADLLVLWVTMRRNPPFLLCINEVATSFGPQTEKFVYPLTCHFSSSFVGNSNGRWGRCRVICRACPVVWLVVNLICAHEECNSSISKHTRVYVFTIRCKLCFTFYTKVLILFIVRRYRYLPASASCTFCDLWGGSGWSGPSPSFLPSLGGCIL